MLLPLPYDPARLKDRPKLAARSGSMTAAGMKNLRSAVGGPCDAARDGATHQREAAPDVAEIALAIADANADLGLVDVHLPSSNPHTSATSKPRSG